jgi:hypothetical protein
MYKNGGAMCCMANRSCCPLLGLGVDVVARGYHVRKRYHWGWDQADTSEYQEVEGSRCNEGVLWTRSLADVETR